MFRHLSYAVRTLAKSPGFTLAAVLTLALGTGANVAIYGVLDAVVLRPVPFRDPERIVVAEYAGIASSSAARLDRLSASAHSYGQLAAYTGWDFALTGSGDPQRLDGARVTPNLFAVLGVAAARGRAFTDEEARRGDGAEAVLSDALWRSRFGGDPAILGRTITLDGRATMVVGVMPAHFAFPTRATQLWTPAPLNPAHSSGYRADMLTLIGRLAPGVTLEAASEELRALRRTLRLEAGVTAPFDRAETRVLPLGDELAGPRRGKMRLLVGIVGLVLLIACANVANLVLLRATTQRRGAAIRAALGASRASLVRELLLESLVIALAGGVVGVGIAAWAHGALTTALLPDAPTLRDAGLDPLLLGIAFLLSLVTAALVGFVPAAQVSRVEAQSVLREGGRGETARSRLRGTLVVSELGLAFALAMAAGLLVKSLWKLEQVDSGFQADQVLTMHVAPSSASSSDSARTLAYWRAALEQVRSVPGVTDAGAIHLTPMGESNWNPALVVEGAPAPRPGKSRSVDWRVATPAYFRTMGIPLRRGRAFTDQDRYGAPGVAIVNTRLTRTYFGSGDPVGKRVRTSFEGPTGWVSIVGEVGDVHGHGLAADPVPEIYRPLGQYALPSMTLMVRGVSDPVMLAQGVKRVLANVDPLAILDEVQPMRAIVEASVASPRHVAVLLLGFGLLALLLAAIGVFAVVSFAVAQRTRELGIRAALGASRGTLLTLVLKQGAAYAGAALLLGTLLALAGSGVVRSQLYAVSPNDPTIYAAALGTLLGVAFLGTALPALRAAKIDPTVALRSE